MRAQDELVPLHHLQIFKIDFYALKILCTCGLLVPWNSFTHVRRCGVLLYYRRMQAQLVSSPSMYSAERERASTRRSLDAVSVIDLSEIYDESCCSTIVGFLRYSNPHRAQGLRRRERAYTKRALVSFATTWLNSFFFLTFKVAKLTSFLTCHQFVDFEGIFVCAEDTLYLHFVRAFELIFTVLAMYRACLSL